MEHMEQKMDELIEGAIHEQNENNKKLQMDAPKHKRGCLMRSGQGVCTCGLWLETGNTEL